MAAGLSAWGAALVTLALLTLPPVEAASADAPVEAAPATPVLLKRRAADGAATRMLRQSVESSRATLQTEALASEQAAARPAGGSNVAPSCAAVMAAFNRQAGSSQAYQQSLNDLGAGTATTRDQAEQRLWYRERMARVARGHPACIADAKVQRDTEAGLVESRQQCDCTVGKNRWFDAARVEAAIAAALAPAAGFAAPSPEPLADGLSFEVCDREAQAVLNIEPTDDTPLLLRRTIAGIDRALGMLTRCEGDGRTKDLMTTLRFQREQALKTCRQIVSSDNCEAPPL